VLTGREGDAMKSFQSKSKFRLIQRTGLRCVRWTAIDTGLGALGGALFGSVFGAFGILIHHDPSQIVMSAGYFALCGAAAGALVGMFATMIDPDESPDPESPSTGFTDPPWVPVDSIRHIVCLNNWQPPITVIEANRRRRETRASRNPSKN
jgi:hypothetical protein